MRPTPVGAATVYLGRSGTVPRVLDGSARRSTLVLVGGSGVSFVLGLLRTKLLALVWGPSGIGQAGLMQAAMGTASLVTGLGVDGLLARDVAASRAASCDVERTLVAGTAGALVLSLVSMVVSSVALSLYMFWVGVGGLGAGVVLGLGAGLSVLSANLKAILTGLGASRGIAMAGVIGAAIALGVAAGLVVLATPSPFVLGFAVACVPLGMLIALARAVWHVGPRLGRAELAQAFGDVLRIARRATVFTFAGVVPVFAQAATRTMAAVSMTETELGQLQAAAAISAISTSLLATSIGPVLIPRLSEAVRAGQRLGPLISQHAVLLVGLYAPVAVAVAGLPGVVLQILYSGRFSGGSDQLAWQIVGEVFRLPVWLMATTLVVRAQGRTYLMMELAGFCVQCFGLWLVLPLRNGNLIGIVFAAAAVTQFLVGSMALHGDGVCWSRGALSWLLVLALACAAMAALGRDEYRLVLTAVCLVPALAGAYRLIRARKAGA